MEIILTVVLLLALTITASVVFYRWKVGVVFLLFGTSFFAGQPLLEGIPHWWKKQKDYNFLTNMPLAEGPIHIDANNSKADIPINRKFLNEIVEKNSQMSGVTFLTEYKVSLTLELDSQDQQSQIVPWALLLVDDAGKEIKIECIPEKIILGKNEWGFGSLVRLMVENKSIKFVGIRDQQPQGQHVGNLRIYLGRDGCFKAYSDTMLALNLYSLLLGIILMTGAIVGFRKRPWAKRNAPLPVEGTA